jgi:hypothetical protein
MQRLSRRCFGFFFGGRQHLWVTIARLGLGINVADFHSLGDPTEQADWRQAGNSPVPLAGGSLVVPLVVPLVVLGFTTPAAPAARVAVLASIVLASIVLASIVLAAVARIRARTR